VRDIAASIVSTGAEILRLTVSPIHIHRQCIALEGLEVRHARRRKGLSTGTNLADRLFQKRPGVSREQPQGFVPVLARRFRSRAVLELENLALRQQLHLGGLARRPIPTPGGNRRPQTATYFAHLKGCRFRSASLPDKALNEKGPSQAPRLRGYELWRLLASSSVARVLSEEPGNVTAHSKPSAALCLAHSSGISIPRLRASPVRSAG